MATRDKLVQLHKQCLNKVKDMEAKGFKGSSTSEINAAIEATRKAQNAIKRLDAQKSAEALSEDLTFETNSERVGQRLASQMKISVDEATNKITNYKEILNKAVMEDSFTTLRAFEGAMNNALSYGTANTGGNLIAQNLQADLIEAMRFPGSIRDICPNQTVIDSAINITWPTVNTTAFRADKLSETDDVEAGDTITVNHVTTDLQRYTSGRQEAPELLLNAGVIDVVGMIQRVANMEIRAAFENDAINGASTAPVVGLLTSAPSGTSQVTTDAPAAGTTARNLSLTNMLQVTRRMDLAYRGNLDDCVFLVHQDTLTHLETLTDSNGRYLLAPDKESAAAGTLFGHRVYENPNVPNLGTASGRDVVVFFNRQFFDIRDHSLTEFRVYRDYEFHKYDRAAFVLQMYTGARMLDNGAVRKVVTG